MRPGVFLVMMNDQGCYFPKWYTDVRGLLDLMGVERCMLSKIQMERSTRAFIELRADRTLYITRVESDPLVDDDWDDEDGAGDKSYWCDRTPERLHPVLKAMGVPEERYLV